MEMEEGGMRTRERGKNDGKREKNRGDQIERAEQLGRYRPGPAVERVPVSGVSSGDSLGRLGTKGSSTSPAGLGLVGTCLVCR